MGELVSVLQRLINNDAIVISIVKHNIKMCSLAAYLFLVIIPS